MKQRLLILSIVLLIAMGSVVSADPTCSFINITTGPAGTPGTNGTSCNITVNYTFTLPAGSAATATNVGTVESALIDFGIPIGATGATGSAADTSQFLFINGTRAMTGNLSMGSWYINDLITGLLASSAANKSYVDAAVAGITDNDTPYMFINGSRAMTGNISMGNFYINNLITGTTGNTAVNKSYVDSLTDSPVGINLSVIFKYGTGEYGCSTFTFDNGSGIVTAPYFVGDGSGLTGIGSTAATALTFDAKACSDGTIYKGQAVYISGASGSNPVVCHADNTNSAKARVVGIMIADTNANAQGKVRRSGTLTAVDTRSTAATINPLGQTWSAGDLLFATTGGGLTNVRPTSGRSVKVAYSLTGSAVNDVLLAYPLENPVWSTAASGEDIVLRVGDGIGVNNVSIRNYTNTIVANINSLGVATFNGTNELNNITMNNKYITGLMSGDTGGSVVNKSYVDSVASSYNATYNAKVGNPIFGYVTLMAGSAMVTTTNPTTMNQFETTTNKNNYIELNFTSQGTEVGQWMVDFPADWNSTANVIFTPIWTATEGSGDINWTIKAKLFPDDAAMDTELATIGYSVDTLTATGDLDVAPDTTGAAISSAGTGGNTAIIQVSRDATSTLTSTAQLIGLRVKYVRNLA